MDNLLMFLDIMKLVDNTLEILREEEEDEDE